jgi:PqqD family protein of HPr-rel-A system
LLLNSSVSAIRRPSPDPARIWRLATGQALHHREWQGDYVLYNDISGDTHLLDQTAMEVLLTLRDAPTAQAVLLDLLDQLGVAPAPDDDDEAASLLNQLQALALIEVIP